MELGDFFRFDFGMEMKWIPPKYAQDNYCIFSLIIQAVNWTEDGDFSAENTEWQQNEETKAKLKINK